MWFSQQVLLSSSRVPTRPSTPSPEGEAASKAAVLATRDTGAPSPRVTLSGAWSPFPAHWQSGQRPAQSFWSHGLQPCCLRKMEETEAARRPGQGQRFPQWHLDLASCTLPEQTVPLPCRQGLLFSSQTSSTSYRTGFTRVAGAI